MQQQANLTLIQRIKQTFKDLNWKYVAIGAGITFLLMPYPFIKILKPIINRINHAYSRALEADVKKIIFATPDTPIDQILWKLKLKNHQVEVLNFKDVCDSSNNDLCQIWGQAIYMQLKDRYSPYVVVFASPRIIQNIQMKFYHMELNQRYKLNVATDREFHVINYESRTFRLTYESIES